MNFVELGSQVFVLYSAFAFHSLFVWSSFWSLASSVSYFLIIFYLEIRPNELLMRQTASSFIWLETSYKFTTKISTFTSDLRPRHRRQEKENLIILISYNSGNKENFSRNVEENCVGINSNLFIFQVVPQIVVIINALLTHKCFQRIFFSRSDVSIWNFLIIFSASHSMYYIIRRSHRLWSCYYE